MAERHTAAVRVHAVAREGSEVTRYMDLAVDEFGAFERLDMSENLSREGFMNFPQMDVRIVQGVALQQARYRVGRRHQQTFNPEIDRRDFPVNQLHARCRGGESCEAGIGRDPDTGSAVG